MISEGKIAERIKNEERTYKLPLRPLRKLLQQGSKMKMLPGTEEELKKSGAIGTNHKMSEAALLEFRRQVEDFALELAGEIGVSARNDTRVTIKYRDVVDVVRFRRQVENNRVME
jgi:histone H3/H4